MRNKKLLWALAPLALAACTQDEIVPGMVVEGNAVTFSASADRQSRAGSTVNSTLETENSDWGIGLYGYYTGQDAWKDANISKPDFMKDQLVTYNGTGWEYTPVKYWPNTTGDKLSFIAYYPKLVSGSGHPSTSAAVSAADDETKGLPEVTVDITDGNGDITQASMLDFVVAESGTFDKQKSGGTVALGFSHAMSRVNISARQLMDNQDGYTYVFVEAVTIKSTAESNLYKSGVYYWTKTGAGVTGAWKVTDDDKYGAGTDIALSTILATASVSWGNYSGTAVKLDQDGDATGLLKSGEYLFFIPTGGESLGATAEITYAVATTDTELDDKGFHSKTTVEVPLDELKLEKGTAYNLCFTIGLSEVKVNATVEDWDSEIQVLLPTQTASLTAGDTNANTTAIANAWAAHAATKGAAGNNDHFVIKCTGEGVTAADIQGLNFSSATIAGIENFIYGDRIELQLVGSDGLEQDLTGVNVTLPEGWVLKEVGNSNSGKNLLFERSVSPTLESLSRAGANCYIINQADIDKGYIVVPLSQVEEALEVVDQLDNSTDAMTAYTAAIASYGNMKVETLWTDGSGSVTGSVLEENGKYYAKLVVSGLSLGQNIVVKLTDGAATPTTLWSWHLWVTDYDLGATPTNGAIYQLNTVAFTSGGGLEGKYMMDRNLGATVTGFSGYGVPASDDAAYYGLKYQYGRKDPFKNQDYVGNSTLVSLYGTVKEPDKFYTSGGYWNTYDNGDRGNKNLWDLDNNYKKSPFDPCPAGWRVPSDRTDGAKKYNPWTGMEFFWTVLERVLIWENYGSSITIAEKKAWFPAAGVLYYGSFVDAGEFGSCWLSSLSNASAKLIEFRYEEEQFSPFSNSSRPRGLSVRCVQE